MMKRTLTPSGKAAPSISDLSLYLISILSLEGRTIKPPLLLDLFPIMEIIMTTP
jgi:hypothetical protein